MRQPRAALALFAATLARTNAAAVVASAARGFLAQLAQPDLVASKLLAIEDDWKAQVRIFAECVARGGAEASGTTCGRVQSLFQQSCSAISAAFIQGQGGDPNGVSRFMDGVCAGAAADHDHQELCAEFKEELLRGISAGGQDGLTGVSSCQRLWIRLINKDQQALQSNQTSTKEQGRTTATQPEHKHLEDKAVEHWHAEQHQQAYGKAHQNAAVVQPAKGIARVESSKQPQTRESLADRDSNISRGVHATLPPTPGGAVTRSLQIDEAKAALDGARAKAKDKVATPERNPSSTRSINHIDSEAERQASVHARTSRSEESVSKRMNSGRKSDLHGQGEVHGFEHQHQVAGAVAESNPEASEQALLARWRQEQSKKHRRGAAKAAAGPSAATVLHASEARRHRAEERATAAQRVLEKALAAEQHIKEVSTERKKRRIIKEIEDRKRWAAEARERRRKLQEERMRKMEHQEHARAGKGERARSGRSDNATGAGHPRAQPNASRVLVKERLGGGAAPRKPPGPEAPATPAPPPSPAKRQRAVERAAAAKKALEEAETEERRVKAAALSLAARRQRAAGAGALGAAAGRRAADAEGAAEGAAEEAEAGDGEESQDSTSEEQQDTANEDSGDAGDAASKDKQKSEAEQEEEDDGDDNHADDDS